MLAYARALTPARSLYTGLGCRAMATKPDIAVIKEVRERTGAGMKAVKEALVAAENDIEKAIEALRKAGSAMAAKRAGKSATAGLVGTATGLKGGLAGALAELNCETDFVARNDKFMGFAGNLTRLAAGHEWSGTGAQVLDGDQLSPFKLDDEVSALVSSVGEKCTPRRVGTVEVTSGLVAGYTHGVVNVDQTASETHKLGSLGVLVGLESTLGAAALAPLGDSIAKHVAAAAPQFLLPTDVTPDALEKEAAIAREQALAAGKSEKHLDKIVEGRLRKYKEDVCLVEQAYMGPEVSEQIVGAGLKGKKNPRIKDIVAAAGKHAGADVSITGFLRFKCGEGITAAAGVSFAEEVAQQLAKA